jgi:catabolite repression HPr-like protein
MTKREITIQLPSGLEARPVALLVQVASQYASEIHLESEGRSVNAKSIMGMMTLGLASGEKVLVTANGVDEEAAVQNIEEYLSAKR